MNSITERWVKTLRAELLDRTLIWNEIHLRHALHEYERHYNLHRTSRPRRGSTPPGAAPPYASPYADTRLGGLIHDYRHAA